jgi:hypothetical protein
MQEIKQEIKQLSRRAEMAAGPAMLAGGRILLLIPSLPRCGLFSGGNLGRPA